MKEKVRIKAGKFELIPITQYIEVVDIEKKLFISNITKENLSWTQNHISEYDVIFLICDSGGETILGNVMCKADGQDFGAIELFFRNVDNLSIKDVCNVIYYSSQWLFKFLKKNRVLIRSSSFEKKIINRLKLLEFKNSKRDGYLERTIPDNDPTAAILSVLSSL